MPRHLAPFMITPPNIVNGERESNILSAFTCNFTLLFLIRPRQDKCDLVLSDTILRARLGIQ